MPKLAAGTCSECGKTFKPYNSRQKTCSKVCSELRDIRQKRDDWRAKQASKVHACFHCGKEFVPHRWGVVTCSDNCHRERRNQQRAQPKNPNAVKVKSGDCTPETAQAILSLLRNDPEARLAFLYMQAGRSQEYANRRHSA